jgi:hypothetical protein
VAVADAVAEADSDDLSVGVAVVTRPHADAVRTPVRSGKGSRAPK